MTFLFTTFSALLIVSTLTSLATEGIKKILDEKGISYYSNLLVGIVAVILSILYGIGYIIIAEWEITAAIIVYIICFVFMSWLCAMLGYDKVIQTLKQLQGGND